MSGLLGWAWLLVGVGALLGALGAALLVLARRTDAENWILQRAPLLPLHLLNARDDAWVRGETRCGSPLRVPHFDDACVAYVYSEAEKVEESYEDSRGGLRTRTRWITRQSRVDAIDFEIVEGDGSIRIHADEAELRALPGRSDVTHGGRLRHSASYLPYPSTVSALGCVSEHADWLEKHANIPLIVTPRTRAEMIDASESVEGATRACGHVALLLGLTGVLYGLFVRAGFPTEAAALWSPPHAILAAIAGATLFVSAWTLYAFNTMLTYRLRTKTAWHQIDVDLKHRFDLVPRLADVVRGAARHEEALLSELAALRSGADRGGSIVERDRESAGLARKLVLIREEHPDLGTAPLFSRLHRELVALEEKIAHGRAFYDDCATEFNSTIAKVPHAWVARLCGFEEAPLFRAKAEEKPRPRFRVVGPKRRSTSGARPSRA